MQRVTAKSQTLPATLNRPGTVPAVPADVSGG